MRVRQSIAKCFLQTTYEEFYSLCFARPCFAVASAKHIGNKSICPNLCMQILGRTYIHKKNFLLLKKIIGLV